MVEKGQNDRVTKIKTAAEVKLENKNIFLQAILSFEKNDIKCVIDDCWFSGVGATVGLSVAVVAFAVLAAVLFFKLKQVTTASKQQAEGDFTELKTTSSPKQPATYANVAEVVNQPMQSGNPTSVDVEDRSTDYDTVVSGKETVNTYETISRDSSNQEHVYEKPGI